MAPIRLFINTFLAIIKWPLIAFLLIAFPSTLKAFYTYYTSYFIDPRALIEFLIGFLAFLVIYALFFRKISHYFKTVVHELTHGIFCVLCLNRIRGIYASFRGGGHIEYAYKGNWLISISPYFFPSFSVFLMTLMAVTGRRPEYSIVLLGFLTSFQVISNYVQIHPRQTDFIQAGWVFTVFFIPLSNVLMWGIILTFVDNGVAGSLTFLNLAFSGALGTAIGLINSL